jgi:AcrR family transcriptional regulator
MNRYYNIFTMTKPVNQPETNHDNSVAEENTASLSDLFMQWTKKRKIRAYSSNQRLIESQRKKIIKRASKAFMQNGVNGVTMEDIARLSHMCVGSIYRYFGSKDDLLISFLREFETRLKECVQARLPEIEGLEPKAALKELIRSYMQAVDLSRDQVLILYLDVRNMPRVDQEMVKRGDEILVGLFEEVISRGIKTGAFQTSDIKLCAHNIKALADVWAVRGWALSREQTVEKYIEYQIDFILGGLTANVK